MDERDAEHLRAFFERVVVILNAHPDETPTAYILAAVAVARKDGISFAQLANALEVAWSMHVRISGNAEC